MVISYIFEETLVLPIIYRKCEDENEKRFKEEELFEILKILCLITLKIWLKKHKSRN